ncbi:hypothetical protein LCGC14_0475140 [marine sediment metagenome]|uniref:Uncharacterized protein n=1 Tax=marine sediment metagenome TaxID=412755 RepID=A0A0F9UXS6_9ZZZZ
MGLPIHFAVSRDGFRLACKVIGNMDDSNIRATFRKRYVTCKNCVRTEAFRKINMETSTIEMKNIEIIFGATTDLSWWNIGLHWSKMSTATGNKSFILSINILCFRFWVEIWRWKK